LKNPTAARTGICKDDADSDSVMNGEADELKIQRTKKQFGGIKKFLVCYKEHATGRVLDKVSAGLTDRLGTSLPS
jgi:hypothetical protein